VNVVQTGVESKIWLLPSLSKLPSVLLLLSNISATIYTKLPINKTIIKLWKDMKGTNEGTWGF
jgi:hypothetical protein